MPTRLLQPIRRHARWGIVVVLAGFIALILANREVVTAQWHGRSAADIDTEARADAALDVEDVPGYGDGRAPFTVVARDVLVPYSVLFLTALPGEEVPLRIGDPTSPGVRPGRFDVEVAGGTVDQGAEGRWLWTAPAEPGLYPIRIEGRGGTMTLQAFVMRPFERGQTAIGDFRIGQYPAEPFQDNPLFEYPQGFIEVTPELMDARVSPHFTLGQFVSRQAGDFPKYLLLHPRLLINLEVLLEELNRDGIDATGFHVMSAFRTPFYNYSIGNRTTHSAHLYGLAADIFVDEEDNQYMDDLNNDGVVDIRDARIMYETAERVEHETVYERLEGGIGIYAPAAHRGPFIHVDVRGEPVRWGP